MIHKWLDSKAVPTFEPYNKNEEKYKIRLN